jgi:Na+-driven multidrug efflux pump
MGVTDTIFISRLGDESLAAQSLASFIHMAIFMTLIAFVFPVANLYKLAEQDKNAILKSGLVVTVGLSLFLSTVYLVLPAVAKPILQETQQEIFVAYLVIIAFSLLPGGLFFYCRMLLYTEDKPKQIGHWIVLCIILNACLDYVAFTIFSDIILITRSIAFITVLIFYLLVLLCNLSLDTAVKLQNIIFYKTNYASYLKVTKSTLPAGITALGEYGFFAVLAIMVALLTPVDAAAYRVVLQLEEMLIIIFYAFARVLSLEVSKAHKGEISSSGAVYYQAMLLLLLTVFSLPIFYPYALKLYAVDVIFSRSEAGLIMLLLLAEAAMLYICAFLWGLARYTTVAVVSCLVNWGIILPLLYFWPPSQVEVFYYALIVNYALISITLLAFVKNFKSL